MKIGIGNILEHLQMLSTKTFVVKKMVYPSQRLDAKPVESCVSVRRRADPRCFLRRINSCRAAAAEEKRSGGAERELSPVLPLLFRISQSVRLLPSLPRSSVRRLRRPKGAAPLLPSVQSSPFFFPE